MKKIVLLSNFSLLAAVAAVSAAECAAAGCAAADRAVGMDGANCAAAVCPAAAGCGADVSAAASTVAPAAADRAAEIVAALAAKFRAMQRYEVAFEVAMGEHRTAGSYSVEDGRYYLTLGDAEVFADAGIRYEVDRRRREVTIVGVDAADRNLLNDPIHAFDFLDRGYRSELAWERNGEAAVSLVPTEAAGSAAGRITLVVDTCTMQPRSVAYDFDGDRIEVSVLRVGTPARPVRTFDAAEFAGFEWIDFR